MCVGAFETSSRTLAKYRVRMFQCFCGPLKKKKKMLDLQKTLEICITIQDTFTIEDLD